MVAVLASRSSPLAVPPLPLRCGGMKDAEFPSALGQTPSPRSSGRVRRRSLAEGGDLQSAICDLRSAICARREAEGCCRCCLVVPLPVTPLSSVVLAGARGARAVLLGLARCTWCVRSPSERRPCSDVPRPSARRVDRRDPCRCVTAGDRGVPRGTSLPVRGVARGAWTAGGTLTLPQRTGGPRACRDTRLAPRPALLSRARSWSCCARRPRDVDARPPKLCVAWVATGGGRATAPSPRRLPRRTPSCRPGGRR